MKGNLGVSLDQLNEGSTVGVIIEGNSLRLFVDKKDYGVIAQDLPPTCYAVVDLYGQCEQVGLVIIVHSLCNSVQ